MKKKYRVRWGYDGGRNVTLDVEGEEALQNTIRNTVERVTTDGELDGPLFKYCVVYALRPQATAEEYLESVELFTIYRKEGMPQPLGSHETLYFREQVDENTQQMGKT